MEKHVLDPTEQQLDRQTPGEVTVTGVDVARVPPSASGHTNEDPDGSVVVYLTPPKDDRTPPEKMGYRVRLAGGTLPGSDMLPAWDVRAILIEGRRPHLVFYWVETSSTARPPFQFIISVAAVDLGGRVGPRTFIAVGDPAVAMPLLDEQTYSPGALYARQIGVLCSIVSDGASLKLHFDNREDAQNGLWVAQRYTRHGFVGRNNQRPNHDDYVLEYWAGASGLPPAALSQTDRIPYDPDNLFAHDLGAVGWSIQDGDHMLLTADNAGDAAAELNVISRHHLQCFIGRDNRRPNRSYWIMSYWE